MSRDRHFARVVVLPQVMRMVAQSLVCYCTTIRVVYLCRCVVFEVVLLCVGQARVPRMQPVDGFVACYVKPNIVAAVGGVVIFHPL